MKKCFVQNIFFDFKVKYDDNHGNLIKCRHNDDISLAYRCCYTTYHEYSQFKQLKTVKDADGKLLSENEYHYKGQN